MWIFRIATSPCTISGDDMLIKLAWRNLWRNTRRTLLTILALSLSLIFLILTLEIYDYMMLQSVKDTLSRFTGHARLSRKDFFEEFKLSLSIPVDSFPSSLRENPEVEGYTPRLMTFALISSGNETRGIQLLGVDTSGEKRTTRLLSAIEGRMDASGKDIPCVVPGKPVLELMGRDIGDTLFVVGNGWDGSIYAEDVLVCGVFETGNPSIDASTALIEISSLQKVLNLEGRAHYFVIRLRHPMKALRWKSSVRIPEGMELKVWQEWMKSIWEIIRIWGILKIIFGLIFYMAVVLIAFNSLMMAFFERRREFAVILALGMKRSLLFLSVFLEGVIMGIASIVIALPLSLIIAITLRKFPIDLSGLLTTTSWEGMHIIPRISAMLNPENYWISTGLLLLLVIISSLAVAARVLWIDISSTLRERMV